MELNKNYKALNNVISRCSVHLSSIDIQQQEYHNLRRVVEEHFERSIHALEARRDELLNQLDLLAVKHYEKIEEVHEKLSTHISNCKEILKTGTTIYSSSTALADSFWKGALYLHSPSTSTRELIFNVGLDLPDILDQLHTHGAVIQNPSSIASNSLSTGSSSATPLVPTPTAAKSNSTSEDWSSGEGEVFEHNNVPKDGVKQLGSGSRSHPAKFALESSFDRALEAELTQNASITSKSNSPTLPLTLPNSINYSVELVSSLAGGNRGRADGTGESAKFGSPWGMCRNPLDDCLYVADYANDAIRRITIQGEVSTFARTFIERPSGIVWNHNEKTFYVTCSSSRLIIRITAAGECSILAGNREQGCADGFGTAASFNYPIDVAVDPQTGNLYVSDNLNHMIRKITPNGEVSSFVGRMQKGFVDGNKLTARFDSPHGICFDEEDNSLVVSDYANNKLRRVQLNGDVSTLCYVPWPTNIAVVGNQTFLVSSDTNKIFKVSADGSEMKYRVEVLAGSGKRVDGIVDGRAEECCFQTPRGIAVHGPSRSCFIADFDNCAIRQASFVKEYH